MEDNCPHPISYDTVIEVRDLVEDFIVTITKEATFEFNELNDNREKQGLPRLKRLNQWSIKRSLEKTLSDHCPQDVSPATGKNQSQDDKKTPDKTVIKPNLEKKIWGTS